MTYLKHWFQYIRYSFYILIQSNWIISPSSTFLPGSWPSLSVIWRDLSSLCSNLIQRPLPKIKSSKWEFWDSKIWIQVIFYLIWPFLSSGLDFKTFELVQPELYGDFVASSDSCQIMHDNLRRLFDSEMTIKQTKELIFIFYEI